MACKKLWMNADHHPTAALGLLLHSKQSNAAILITANEK